MPNPAHDWTVDINPEADTQRWNCHRCGDETYLPTGETPADGKCDGDFIDDNESERN